MVNEKRNFIDRDALIDSLGISDREIFAKEVISEAPIVEVVEVVHGKWVHPKGHIVSNKFLCTVCNHGESSYHVINPLPGGGCKADENGNFYYPPRMNYCPNCGAKMDNPDIQTR